MKQNKLHEAFLNLESLIKSHPEIEDSTFVASMSGMIALIFRDTGHTFEQYKYSIYKGVEEYKRIFLSQKEE